MISLGYGAGGNKEKQFNKTDVTWNDPRDREETKIKLSSRENSTTVSSSFQASWLPAPKSSH